jgi:hypothetical protein
MCYLKITAPDKTVTFVSENTNIVLGLTAYTKVNGVSRAGRIVSVEYSDVTPITNIPAYDGTNTLYEYGKLSDHGQIQTIFSNKDTATFS